MGQAVQGPTFIFSSLFRTTMTSTFVSITVTVHIPLPLENHTNTWYRALAIPVHRLSHFSNSPLRWLCYLGFALTASKGKLCESGRPESDPVNYDLPVPLDSSTDYYFHPEQDVRPIDPDVEANSDSSTNESARDDFRERLISRDGTCVVNEAVAVSCEGAHLIRFSRGNEYIEHLTTFRSCEDDDSVISNINDTRNGLLVNSTLHKFLCKSVAFLQTPNFILSPRHVDPENTSNALCIYSHDFQDKIVCWLTVSTNSAAEVCGWKTRRILIAVACTWCGRVRDICPNDEPSSGGKPMWSRGCAYKRKIQSRSHGIQRKVCVIENFWGITRPPGILSDAAPAVIILPAERFKFPRGLSNIHLRHVNITSFAGVICLEILPTEVYGHLFIRFRHVKITSAGCSLVPLLQGVFICCVSWILWKYFPRIIGKSALDNIPGPPRQSFWKGNIDQLFGRHAWGYTQGLSEKYGSVVKLHSIFGQKLLYVYDPKALHSIIVKDQHIYEESPFFIKTNLLTLGPGLLSTLGDHHRKQRKLLNPVFSIKHMRRMMPVFYQISHKLCDAIESGVRTGAREVDMLGWMGRTALELIGQAGLGYSFDPLVEDMPNPYGDAIKNFLPVMSRLQVLRRMITFIPLIGPPALRRKIVEMFPHKGIKQLISIVDAMHTHSTEIFEKKKEALKQGGEAISQEIEEKDIMSILLKANIAASEKDRLPEHELIAQMSTLTFAAMDTTSNALSLILQLLAEHPDVQDRVRTEILEASNGEDLPYDKLIELPYLDAVCRETLRLRAPVTFVFRETARDTVMPLLEPIRGVDGSIINEIPVPKNTGIVVGVLASNCNKAVWGDDALEWKPERWLSPLPATVGEAHIPGVYSNLMTFIGGGRACIGFKFSQLEMKVVLSLLLSRFTFSLSDKPIVWNLAGVRYPTVGKDSTKPEMWLKVGLAKNAA
ncbi:Docosahexaenoic acid omega-hydroxylase CYP4F3 [Grifola frondosa]|uniref:Docosahexaenoic acid omega-hydroxylase CYP4F3 n=1 Tax=Grifola frondosa TaxID=5627 RepID=A0A1C7LSL9_GRIFR|nr:Docosahexaenoic acid omega-hydroxylase CYP4F3 [Grifola frondosa]